MHCSGTDRPIEKIIFVPPKDMEDEKMRNFGALDKSGQNSLPHLAKFTTEFSSKLPVESDRQDGQLHPASKKVRFAKLFQSMAGSNPPKM